MDRRTDRDQHFNYLQTKRKIKGQMKLSPEGYVFRKKALRAFFRLADVLGAALFHFKEEPGRNSGRILIIRIDQIGDIVAIDPFLTLLKKENPKSEIILLTTPSGAALYSSRREGSGGPLAEICTIEADWHKPGGKFRFSSFLRLKKMITQTAADHVIDLRGDIRHIAAARCALPKAYIESYGITGGSFLLNRTAKYKEGCHAVLRGADFLQSSYSENDFEFSTSLACSPLPQDLADSLEDRPSKRIALHPGAGNEAKRWSSEKWILLVRELLKKDGLDLVWIGDVYCESVIEEISQTVGEESSRIKRFSSRLPLGSLGSFLSGCDLLISADSGPVHIAAAQNTPCIVLFSGTSDVAEWYPWSVSNRVLQHKVPCSPCYLTRCKQPTHECMDGISPDAVVSALEDILQVTG